LELDRQAPHRSVHIDWRTTSKHPIIYENAGDDRGPLTPELTGAAINVGANELDSVSHPFHMLIPKDNKRKTNIAGYNRNARRNKNSPAPLLPNKIERVTTNPDITKKSSTPL
jgi:hypothetical protein